MSTSKIPSPGSVYRHFKGNTYSVIGIFKHSETKEHMVAYVPLGSPGDVPKLVIDIPWGWVRPLSMWDDHIERTLDDGSQYSGPRFKHV